MDELDRELQRRGLHFVRYADDSNIYVRSRRAGVRVKDLTPRNRGASMESVIAEMNAYLRGGRDTSGCAPTSWSGP